MVTCGRRLANTGSIEPASTFVSALLFFSSFLSKCTWYGYRPSRRWILEKKRKKGGPTSGETLLVVWLSHCPQGHFWCYSNPGSCVQYAYYLHHKSTEYGLRSTHSTPEEVFLSTSQCAHHHCASTLRLIDIRQPKGVASSASSANSATTIRQHEEKFKYACIPDKTCVCVLVSQ